MHGQGMIALNEKRHHQPALHMPSDSIGYNPLIANAATPGDNLEKPSLDPFNQPYLNAERDDNKQYF